MPRQKRSGYWIKKPGGGRRTFALVQSFPNGKTKHLPHPTLDAINADFLAGHLTLMQAEGLVEKLRTQLLDAERPPKLEAARTSNLDIVDRYWEDEYTFRDLADTNTMLGDLRRAVNALGPLDLHTATVDAINRQLASLRLPAATHNRRVARLRQLLKYLKRPEVGRQLRLRRIERRVPTHLTEKELMVILNTPGLEGEIRVAVATLFYTGVRLGELFTIRPESFLADNLLFIAHQVRRDGRWGPPKNREPRQLVIPPAGVKWAHRWAKMGVEMGSDKSVWAERTKAACRVAGVKEVTPLELRHSYAIYMLSFGLSSSALARMMGHDERVNKLYYSGLVHTDETIAAVLYLMKKKQQ